MARNSASRKAAEEIDLTLSSPEPEPARFSQTPRSHLHSSRTGSNKSRRGNIDHRIPGMRARGQGDGPHPARINPVHIARLIDTSDTRAVKRVLLELCELSPAFSGALVRGLATHSTFAKELLRTYGQDGTRRTSQPQPSDLGRDSDHSVSGSIPTRDQSSRNIRRVKAEPQRSSAILNDSPSNGLACSGAKRPARRVPPGAFPQSPVLDLKSDERKPVAAWLEHQESLAAASASRMGLGPHSSITVSNRSIRSRCQNCGMFFTEPSEEDECYYHTGHKRMVSTIAGQRVLQYTCCKGSEYDAPCQSGPHIGQTVSKLDFFKRPLPAPTTSGRPSKSPRLL
jgi:hypothetical protein